MPLASWANLHWNGEASLAGVALGAGAGSGDVFGSADALGFANGAGAAQGTLTRLLDAAGFSFGLGETAGCDLRGTASLSGIVKIGELSQDDVTGAVLEAPIEGGLSLKQTLRLLLAHAAGDATGLDGGSIAFKSVDGSVTRVAGTISGGNRTITALDGG